MATTTDIREYIGISSLVAAEMLTDTTTGATWGTPFSIAGTATLTRATASSSSTKYYDNFAAIVTDSKGADTITCEVSTIPLDVLAKLTGEMYDDTADALYEASEGGTSGLQRPYFAIGYVYEDTDGNKTFVWRYKCKINQVPDQTHQTRNDGDNSVGQTLEFVGVDTIALDTHTKNHMRSALYEATKQGGSIVQGTFFQSVMTPSAIHTACEG